MFRLFTAVPFKGNAINKIGHVNGVLLHYSSSTSNNVDKHESFKYADLEIQLADPTKLQPKPFDDTKLLFGTIFTDHMLEIKWSINCGWSKPIISPFHNLSIHPAAKVLHYSIELIEGMKAYYGIDGRIRMFRPDLNMHRLARSSTKLLLPTFEHDELLKCIKKLIRIDQEWIPRSENCSLYIRPTFIGTEPTLGAASSQTALLFVILSPVGPYFPTGFKPVSLLADPRYARSWPGGCGDTKLGSNYGPVVSIQAAEKAGIQQVLWLFGKDQQITEVGSMNIFIFLKNNQQDCELVTPPLNGLILPGIIRQSILDLAREWKEFQVTERRITIKEVIQAVKDNQMLEIFGTGTACIICPVSSIHYEGIKYDIPTVEHKNPIHLRFHKCLNDIYYGRLAHSWGVLVK